MAVSVRQNKTPSWVPFAASTMTGISFAPLELGSTRSKSKESMIRGFKLIPQVYKKEGIFALWRGSGWFVLGNAAARTTWLISYDYFKQSLLAHKKHTDPETTKLGNKELMMAGFGSGAITAIVTNPIWTLKSFAQLPNYPGLFYSPQSSLFTNPFRNFNSPDVIENRKLTLRPQVLMAGTIPAIGYVATESMFQLFILEKLKESTKDYTQGLAPFASGIVGGLLGGISRVAILPVTFPLHVITLRVREQYKPQNNSKQSILQIIKGIHSDRAWYAGIGPYTARVVPQAVVLFFMVEGIRATLSG